MRIIPLLTLVTGATTVLAFPAFGLFPRQKGTDCAQPCGFGDVCRNSTCIADDSQTCRDWRCDEFGLDCAQDANGQTGCYCGSLNRPACGLVEACPDLMTDQNNCGKCFQSCDRYETCRNGTCIQRPPDGCTPRCEAGQQCFDGKCYCTNSDKLVCSGYCPKYDTDSRNCGSCGNNCGDGAYCKDGTCTKYQCDASCVAPMICMNQLNGCYCPSDAGNTYGCNGTCPNLSTDPNNCGACDIKCKANERCVKGGCVPGDCPGSQLMCDGACRNWLNDNNNCGACGRVCQVGRNCVDGSCGGYSQCPPDQSICGDQCVNLLNDNNNCRYCGRSCPAGQNCEYGYCV